MACKRPCSCTPTLFGMKGMVYWADHNQHSVLEDWLPELAIRNGTGPFDELPAGPRQKTMQWQLLCQQMQQTSCSGG